VVLVDNLYQWSATMGGETFFKVGAQLHVKKTIEYFCSLNVQL